MANLLQLTTVYTKPRERISSDEEERRRAGFRLVTSYRFADHGPRSGRLDAVVEDADGDRFATLAYGDSATVRITNLGRSRAARDEPDGFNLDQTDGRWVANRAERSASGDSGETPLADEDQHRVIRVLPFVEDRRNILVLQSAEPMDREAALSVMYALERGVETAFQLEDAELTTELLTTRANQPTRILFTESAEGGAGVLRRLQAEPDALARAAAAALDIAHFDRDGTDLGGPRRDRPCARGCYDCLLTYANQMDHAAIDRHRAAPLLLRLAHAHARPAAGGETPSGQYRRLSSQAESGLEQRVLAWLRDRGHRLPDEMQTYLPAAQARPDFVYRLPSANVAVFVDGPVHGHTAVATRDAEAEERLLDLGWQVIRFPAAESAWAEVVRQNQGCFGPGVAQR